MKRFAVIILSPLLCLAVLAGMWTEAKARVKPACSSNGESGGMWVRSAMAGV